MNFIIPVLIGSLLFSTGCYKNPDRNVLFQSDFEGQLEIVKKNWVLTKAYRVDSCILRVSENAHSGENSFEISRVWCDAWSRAGIETTVSIPVKSEKKYLLNFWYKTENIFEYALPLVVQFKVERKNHEPLTYGKSLSWCEFQWNEAFLLLENLPPDALSVQLRFFTRFRIKGSIFIDDIQFYEASESDVRAFEKWRRQDIQEPVKTVATVQKSERNGYFSLQEENNRWWFVAPDGKRHWSIGTMAAMPGNSGNGNTEVYEWYQANYNQNPEGFAKMLFDSLKNWGFNSYAGWTSDYFARISENNFENRKDYFPMFRVLGLARMGDRDYYAKDRNGHMKDGDHSMVDPFNPTWQKEAREKAQRLIPEYRDKPWFVGWYIDNEIEFNDFFKFV